MTEKLSEAELIKLAQLGDSDAEEKLIREYMPLVKTRAQLYFIAGADDEDTIQEGMIGLVKAIANFDAQRDAGFKTFAELCINRQILSAIKAANRQKHAPLNESLSMEAPTGSEEGGGTIADTINAIDPDNPESLLIVKDIIERFDEIEESALSKLELEVWSEHKKGNSVKAIAKSLSKEEKSVENALQRAKRKLAAAIKGN